MEFQFDNNTPIYVQLVEQLKTHIISGNLTVGERLPSVRDLALQTKVNPNTMQKALSELESLGLIYTERTNGKYVTKDLNLINRYKKECAKSLSKKYLKGMEKIGFKKTEIIEYLNELGE